MTSSRTFRALISMLAFAAMAVALTSTSSSAAVDDRKTTEQGPVVLKVADYSVNFGGSFRLRGKTGNPYKGHIRIESLANGRWKTIRKLTTRESGRFEARVPARTSTRFRIRTGDGRLSKVRNVAVIGRVKLARTGRYVKLGDSLVIRGNFRPRGVRKLHIRIHGAGHSVTTRTRADGSFRLRWQPRAAGDFSYLVRAAGNQRSTGDRSLRRRISALRPGHASYYGPGLYGNGVACGGTLMPNTRGVAHKTLPCGTKVTLQYGNRTVVARVIDRGPYIAGRDWDLTEQTRNDLGFGGVGVVWTNK